MEDISPGGRGQPATPVEGSSVQLRALGFLAVAQLLGMTLWFSASAVAPTLTEDWGLSSTGTAWLTNSVQIGFVVGTLASAFFNLPDIVNSRYLFAASALLGAATNAAFAFGAQDLGLGIPLRFMTGVFLAGVYPPGMKLAATWSRRYRGLAVGLLVGALTLGSASPHLVRSLTDLPWQDVVQWGALDRGRKGAVLQRWAPDRPGDNGRKRPSPASS